jgi:glutamate-1-semialdehyde aminotransferase
MYGLEGMYGLEPDLLTFGKVTVGGGLPAAAYGGPAARLGRVVARLG